MSTRSFPLLFGLALVAGLALALATCGDDSPAGVCDKAKSTWTRCGFDGAAVCPGTTGGQPCTNAQEILSAYGACLDKGCAEIAGCIGTIPTCTPGAPDDDGGTVDAAPPFRCQSSSSSCVCVQPGIGDSSSCDGTFTCCFRASQVQPQGFTINYCQCISTTATGAECANRVNDVASSGGLDHATVVPSCP